MRNYTIGRMYLFRFLSLLALASLPLAAQSPKANAAKVERGRYLAVEIGKCQECHTPRLETGEHDQERWFKGAVLDFAPLKEVKGWHKTSPDLTPNGKLWAKWGEPALIKYLQTGLTPKGTPAEPPMPTYKLTAADAEAIVAYLKTLK
jgi:mono/diheme cytochrome c family protein